MAAQFVVPSSVADWTPRPAPFNVKKCGTNARFSEEASVAERVEPEKYRKNAVVYTAQPLAVGQVWRVTHCTEYHSQVGCRTSECVGTVLPVMP